MFSKSWDVLNVSKIVDISIILNVFKQFKKLKLKEIKRERLRKNEHKMKIKWDDFTRKQILVLLAWKGVRK